MIFQQFNLLQNETVFENVAFPLRVHGGRTREQIAARLPGAVVGRAEAARGPGSRADAAARHPAAGRAVFRAGFAVARQDAPGTERSAAAAGRADAVDHPRSGGRRRLGRRSV
ncbi:hypothetical protein G6F68_015300 [Rhizopus microsporus]|nr:hypothetical protein G6F68_015300 [Rhizopus microsporus]